jgi:hypothetical protein
MDIDVRKILKVLKNVWGMKFVEMTQVMTPHQVFLWTQ